MRRTVTKRASVIDLLETGQQVRCQRQNFFACSDVLRSFELSASLTVATNTTTVTPPTHTRTSCAPCDTCLAQAITTKDGSKYVGGWKDGRMDGEGELHGVDGTIYKVRS